MRHVWVVERRFDSGWGRYTAASFDTEEEGAAFLRFADPRFWRVVKYVPAPESEGEGG